MAAVAAFKAIKALHCWQLTVLLAAIQLDSKSMFIVAYPHIMTCKLSLHANHALHALLAWCSIAGLAEDVLRAAARGLDANVHAARSAPTK